MIKTDKEMLIRDILMHLKIEEKNYQIDDIVKQFKKLSIPTIFLLWNKTKTKEV